MLWSGLMFLVLLIENIIAAYTDIQTGLIKNRLLLISLIIDIPMVFVYFFISKAGLLEYSINSLITMGLVLLLYNLGYWAAGDCKLIVLISIAYPMNLYWPINLSFFPMFSLLVFFMSVAYMGIILDTMYCCIKEPEVLKRSVKNMNKRKVVKSYLLNWICFFSVSSIIRTVFILIRFDNYYFPIFISLLVFIVLQPVVFRFKQVIVISIIVDAVFLFLNTSIALRIGVTDFAFIILIVLIQNIIKIYNYKSIPVDSLKPGMILSNNTVELLYTNMIDLRKKGTESLKSRLNDEEVNIIRSHGGFERVKIVRRMPFAAYMVISLLIYLCIEVYKW